MKGLDNFVPQSYLVRIFFDGEQEKMRSIRQEVKEANSREGISVRLKVIIENL